MRVHLICKKCGATYESRIVLHIEILELVNIHLRGNKLCMERDIEIHLEGNFAS